MIMELAVLNIIEGREKDFEVAFKKAQIIIKKMKGYISHDLKRCLEQRNRYVLIVHWESLEDHTVKFRESDQYQQWKQLLHHFYEPFPQVEHYQEIKL